jgi:hypothetical protein
MLISNAICLRLMDDAMLEPIRIECGSDATGIRQRFYRVRQQCWERGDARFAFLKFQISGTELVISRHRDTAAIEQRLRFRILREAVAWARKQGAGLEQPGGKFSRTENSKNQPKYD